MKDNLFIRISHPWETVKMFIDKIEGKCNSVAVYQHDADEDVSRTHCHMVLKGIQVCRKQVLNIMKSSLQMEGNADFAAKACDESQQPFIYMSKGKLDPVFLKEYSAEQALDWKNLWVEPSDQPKTQTELDLIYEDLCMDMRSVRGKKTWKILMDTAYACVKSKRKWIDQHFFSTRKTIVLTWLDDNAPFGHNILPRNHKWAEDMPEHLLQEQVEILELASGKMIAI